MLWIDAPFLANIHNPKDICYYFNSECDAHRLWTKHCTGVGKILVDQDYDNEFGFLTILSNF